MPATRVVNSRAGTRGEENPRMENEFMVEAGAAADMRVVLGCGVCLIGAGALCV